MARNHSPGKPLHRTIRVMIADDHTLVRQALSASLNQEPDIVVTGQASDGDIALAMARRVHPDIIIMNFAMPGMSGLEATRIIHSEMPGVRIIGLTMHDDRESLSAMAQAGAVTCLKKCCSIEELTLTIRRCA